MSIEYVYLIWADGTNRFKIGSTVNNPYDRLRMLRVGHPYDLQLCGVIETDDSSAQENELHQRFAEYQIHSEWFQFPPTMIQTVLNLFDREILTSLSAYQFNRRKKICTTINCWSDMDHPQLWEQCWNQSSLYCKTPLAEETGWLEEYRQYWMTPQGAAFTGEYKFCCVLITSSGQKEDWGWKIGQHSFNPSKETAPIAIPSAAAIRTVQTKVRRIAAKILAGEPYVNSLKYLNATALLAKLGN